MKLNVYNFIDKRHMNWAKLIVLSSNRAVAVDVIVSTIANQTNTLN